MLDAIYERIMTKVLLTLGLSDESTQSYTTSDGTKQIVLCMQDVNGVRYILTLTQPTGVM